MVIVSGKVGVGLPKNFLGASPPDPVSSSQHPSTKFLGPLLPAALSCRCISSVFASTGQPATIWSIVSANSLHILHLGSVLSLMILL